MCTTAMTTAMTTDTRADPKTKQAQTTNTRQAETGGKPQQTPNSRSSLLLPAPALLPASDRATHACDTLSANKHDQKAKSTSTGTSIQQ